MNYYKAIITETVEKEILIKAHCPFEAQIFAEAIVDKTDVLDLFEDLETNIYIDILTLDEYIEKAEYIDDDDDEDELQSNLDCYFDADDYEEGYSDGYDDAIRECYMEVKDDPEKIKLDIFEGITEEICECYEEYDPSDFIDYSYDLGYSDGFSDVISQVYDEYEKD